MMPLLLATLPAAVATDHDDDTLARLVAAHDRVLTNIPGCHEMEGTHDVHADFGLLGRLDTSWLVRGVLRDGVWERREVAQPANPDTWYPAKSAAASAFGVDPAVPAGAAWGALLLRALPGQVSMQHVERRGAQWALVGTLDGGPRSTNSMVTLFDDPPDRARVVEVRVTSPIRGMVVDGQRVRVVRLVMDLAVGADGVPLSESFDGRFTHGAVTGASKFEARWQSRPCGW